MWTCIVFTITLQETYPFAIDRANLSYTKYCSNSPLHKLNTTSFRSELLQRLILYQNMRCDRKILKCSEHTHLARSKHKRVNFWWTLTISRQAATNFPLFLVWTLTDLHVQILRDTLLQGMSARGVLWADAGLESLSNMQSGKLCVLPKFTSQSRGHGATGNIPSGHLLPSIHEGR